MSDLSTATLDAAVPDAWPDWWVCNAAVSAGWSGSAAGKVHTGLRSTPGGLVIGRRVAVWQTAMVLAIIASPARCAACRDRRWEGSAGRHRR